MGKVALTFSKWRPINVLKEHYVLNGVLFPKTNQTKPELVKVATFKYTMLLIKTVALFTNLPDQLTRGFLISDANN